jgi:hypothetical protein
VNQPDIHAWAAHGFDRFKTVWKFDDFWTRGNTFEACLRFVMAAQAKWPHDPKVREMRSFLEHMISAEENYLSHRLNVKSVWADDFGWWGIACLTARDYLLSTGDTASAGAYLDLAKRCWQEMYRRGYDNSNDAKPVPHGCANAPLPGHDSAAAADPPDGTKNTVTNANLFVLSLRLHDAVKSTDKTAADRYLEMAYRQYLWFSSWFDSNHDYLRVPSHGAGLVQERPHAGPGYLRTDRPWWEQGCVWTGDQGLVLAALAEILKIKAKLSNGVPDFKPAVFEKTVTAWIETIVTGVKSVLFGDDHVLREAPFFKPIFGDDFAKDYVCGRGVLLRYLSENTVRPWLGDRFRAGIVATAKAVWDGRDPANDQFGARWNAANDAASDKQFNEQFKKAWGPGHVNATWTLPSPPEPPCDGILQAAGLDALGAAITIQA